MDNWDVISNELLESFKILGNSISNTPPSLLLIIVAPIAFTVFVFVNWLRKEGVKLEDWDKFKKLLQLTENYSIAPLSRVLIVDDDPDYLLMAEKIFEKKGITVIKAENGQQALDILNEDSYNRIDAVISDDGLPDFNGPEICLKHHHQHPFLLTSATIPKSHTLHIVDGFLDKKETREKIVNSTEKAINHWLEQGKKAA